MYRNIEQQRAEHGATQNKKTGHRQIEQQKTNGHVTEYKLQPATSYHEKHANDTKHKLITSKQLFVVL